MYGDFYYDIKSTPFTERENFNNAILLLTLVRSEYYYIVGFSRLENMIEIAFDYQSDLHGTITEAITLYFSKSEQNVILRARLKNIPGKKAYSRGRFTDDGNTVTYEMSVPTDKIIPISVEKLNTVILEAKSEIIEFLENQYSCYLM